MHGCIGHSFEAASGELPRGTAGLAAEVWHLSSELHACTPVLLLNMMMAIIRYKAVALDCGVHAMQTG